MSAIYYCIEKPEKIRSAMYDAFHKCIISFINSIITGTCKPRNDQGPVSRKSRRLFGPEKPFVELPTACFGEPIF